MARQLQADKHRRHRVRKNEHAELRDLGVSYALHATEHGIKEYNQHAGEQACFIISLEEPGEGHADALHLANDIGYRANNQANDSHHPRSVGVITITDKLGHREFTVLPQIRRDKHSQNHIAACPSHQKNRAAIPVIGETDQAGHGDKRGGRHPIRRGCHTVGHRVNALAGHIEFLRAASA